MMNNPQATEQALSILRNPETFQWYAITLLACVVYIYANEIEHRNWRVIAAGLALYMVHWLFEIGNALIQHFSGHALWTVPTGTAFLLLIGVGVELSLMFSVAGLIYAKMLPADPKQTWFGLNNRVAMAIGCAAFFAIFEIFLAKTPAFVWIYPWWGTLPVFVFVYVPFFLAAFWCHDWRARTQVTFIGTLASVNGVLLVLFAGALGWI